MKFRKDSLLFYQSEIFYTIVVVLCLSLIPILGGAVSLICAFPFVVLILVNPELHKEFISINEYGISCHKSGKQLWAYEWNSVAELKKSSRFLMPSIEVLTYSKDGKPEQFATTNHYFQLGRAARKALTQYYTPKDNALN